MAVDGVTKANEIDRTFDVVEDILKDNVTDPLGRAVADFIKDGFPNPNARENCKDDSWTFPLVVLVDPEPEREPLTVDRSQTISRGTIAIQVDVYARNSQERRTLSDSVMNALYANAGDASTGSLQNLTMPRTFNDTQFFGQDKIKVKTITFVFSRID